MSFTLCTSGAAIVKAGANSAGSTLTISQLNNFSDEAEALCCAAARSDVVTNFGTLTTNGKQILQMITSSHIAHSILGYDGSGLPSRELETRLDILENDVERGLALIREDKNKTYLGISS